VIAAVGGDGTFYEILNGLANRSDAKKALRIPLAPIPTGKLLLPNRTRADLPGSACAICINLFGPADTFNVPLACLNAVKG
jgi:sphingosine kinase